MELKFLVDENVEYTLVHHLRKQGYDVLSVAESYLSLDDAFILHQAAQEQRIVITSDKDFGQLVFKEKMPAAGIILFRLQDQSAAAKSKLLSLVLMEYETQLPGNFVVVSEAKIRIRRLGGN